MTALSEFFVRAAEHFDAASKMPFVVRGVAARGELISWHDLERVVNLSGAELNVVTSERRVRKPTPLQISAALRDGATIEVNECALYVQSLAELSAVLRASIGGDRVDVSVLMSPDPTHNPFPLHHDEFDTMAVQVEGQRRWTFFNPLVADPVGGRPSVEYASSGMQPVLEVTLEPSDVLVFERGWPHLVEGAGSSASLHVDFLVRRTKGVAVCEWLAAVAPEQERLRSHWPLGQDQSVEGQRAAWFAEMREALVQVLTAPEAFESFRRFLRATHPSSPVIQLPIPELTPTTQVSLSHPLVVVGATEEAVEVFGRLVDAPAGVAAQLAILGPSDVVDASGVARKVDAQVEEVLATFEKLVYLGALRAATEAS